jgi:hypothetical protein
MWMAFWRLLAILRDLEAANMSVQSLLSHNLLLRSEKKRLEDEAQKDWEVEKTKLEIKVKYYFFKRIFNTKKQ